MVAHAKHTDAVYEDVENCVTSERKVLNSKYRLNGHVGRVNKILFENQLINYGKRSRKC